MQLYAIRQNSIYGPEIPVQHFAWHGMHDMVRYSNCMPTPVTDNATLNCGFVQTNLP
jgi:hypothetical protein